MSHANAALTPRQRLRVARLVVDPRLAGIPGCRAVQLLLADRETVGRPLRRDG
jgi:hypothetical protein